MEIVSLRIERCTTKAFSNESFSEHDVAAIKMIMTLDDDTTIERVYATDSTEFTADHAAFTLTQLL